MHNLYVIISLLFIPSCVFLLSRISQETVRMYNKISGMTGTAETEAGEFWEIYKLDVVAIPTNRPLVRDDKDDLVFKTNREKYNAVIEDIVQLSEAGRPILVGTTSVENSDIFNTILNTIIFI